MKLHLAAFALALLVGSAASALAAPAPPGDKTTNPLGLSFVPKGMRGYQNRPGDPVVGGLGETVPYKTAKEQWEALKAKHHGGVRLTGNGDLPNWKGIWKANDPFADFDPSLERDASVYGPLSPDNQAYYDKTIKNEENNVEWDTLSACLPNGWPRFVSSTRLKDFAITPDVAFMMNEQTAEIRRIYTDGRDHRPDDEAYPLWEGDSIGFWTGKGDAADLVVWTNHLRANILQRGQPRYSNEAETIEIWHKVDAKHINLDLVLYDPLELTRPWLVHRHYIADTIPDGRIDMWVCAENNASVKRNAQGGTDLALPTEKVRDPNEDPILGDLLNMTK